MVILVYEAAQGFNKRRPCYLENLGISLFKCPTLNNYQPQANVWQPHVRINSKLGKGCLKYNRKSLQIILLKESLIWFEFVVPQFLANAWFRWVFLNFKWFWRAELPWSLSSLFFFTFYQLLVNKILFVIININYFYLGDIFAESKTDFRYKIYLVQF